MYYDSKEVTKEEIQEEEKHQRDTEAYIALKTALQNRLFDVILNWNLFSQAYCFSYIINCRQALPILPSSFRNVEEYIRYYLGFVLQEMQAQALKSLTMY